MLPNAQSDRRNQLAVVSAEKPSGGAQRTRRRGEAIAIAAALFGVSIAVSVRVLTLETLILNNDESAYAADAVAVSQQHTFASSRQL